MPIIGLGGVLHWRDAAEFILAGATAVSAPIGYLAGLKTRTARPALAMAAAIGAAAGFCLAYQRSAGRLMGFLPNDREVEAGLRR